jgi:hypothetical protein
MKRLVYRVCLVTMIMAGAAWSDSPLDNLGPVFQYKGLYGGPFGCEQQFKGLYGVDGGCIERLTDPAGIFAPMSAERIANGFVPIALVIVTLLVADFRYRRRLAARNAAVVTPEAVRNT